MTDEEKTLIKEGIVPDGWDYGDYVEARKAIALEEGWASITIKPQESCSFKNKNWLREWKHVNTGKHSGDIKLKPNLEY